jgi:sugar-specific transcriptional regulator TrmB
MEIQQVLKQSGLSEKQANVYLALLELGTASVQSISQKAGSKRPTTYLILDELEQKGLVSTVPQKKALYTAESPELLIGDLVRKEDLIRRFLPDLLALHNAKKEKPQVQLFSGKEGVKQVYDKIFHADNVDFFGTIQEVVKINPEALSDFIAKVKKFKLPVRELLTNSPEDRKYAVDRKLVTNHQMRFLPPNMEFPSDSALFADSAVFFSFHPQIFAVMITSREVTQSLKTLFELAWQSAEPSA